MIQRIQTLWLLISTLAPLYLIKFPIAKFQSAGEEFYVLGFKGIVLFSGTKVDLLQSLIALPIVIVVIAIVSLASVFLFRKRKIQKILTLVSFVFSAGLLIMTVYHSWHVLVQYNVSIKFVPGLLIPPLLCLSTILAFRGISKDEELVRSYDRLR